MQEIPAGITVMNAAAAAVTGTGIAAQVHGHAVAAMWAVGLALAGAVLAALLLGKRPE